MADEFGASPLTSRSKTIDRHAPDGHMKPGALELDHANELAVLYGDLVEDSDTRSPNAPNQTSTLLKLKASKLQSDLAASEATARALLEEVEMLRAANVELVEKNRTLEYNISSLFNTAKMEIERKDAEIQRLRKDVQGRGGERDQRSRSHSEGRRRPAPSRDHRPHDR